jgi:mannose-6-phosphate isomerase
MMESKEQVFTRVRTMLEAEGFAVVKMDENRPWGGFLVIDEAQALVFIQKYFAEADAAQFVKDQQLSPKFLLVAPGKRLSWQYHHRRAELWRVVEGPVQVATSDSDAEAMLHRLEAGEMISLRQGKRHRLIGMDGWGVVAEIWVHTDAAHPSDEDDIVRLQDDFGRSGGH